jgi:hypothetical protein
MFAPFRWLGLGVVKVAISVAAGGGVALLAMGALAMYDAERWDYRVLDTYGPPIGPLLLSIGAGLATAGGTLYSLFFSPSMPSGDGRWPALRAAGPVRA